MHARTSFTAATLALALAAAAPRLQAQALDATRAPGAPTVDAARVAFHMPSPSAPLTIAAARPSFSAGERYMILGGAVLVVGALVGGNAGPIIMIGGGAVAVYGLYLYLDQSKGATQAGFSRKF